MSKVTSREYKLMLDHRMFADRKPAVRGFWKDAKRIARRCGVETKDSFHSVDKQTIRFIDSPDLAFFRNGLVFRIRNRLEGKSKKEYTLKCRGEDRYVVGAKDLGPGEGLKSDRKFEEDIAPPFRSRFSHSVTIKDTSAGRPKSVSDAARLFPILAALPRDGGLCEGSTPLVIVNRLTAHERVLVGPTFSLPSHCDATIALILWSHSWKGRAISAEFSFRYRDKEENYSPKTAQAAFDLFFTLQTLDWFAPHEGTKTQFAYKKS